MAGSKGSWEKTVEAMENQGSSTYLRLEGDGDKAVVAFCGAPFHRDICFNEKTSRYEAWDETAKAAGRKKSSRYAMNVFVVSAKGVKDEMRVLDMNFQTMQAVIALKDKYGFAKNCFEITRHGAKGDTKTNYTILPDLEITDAIRAAAGAPDPADKNSWKEGTAALIDLEEATAKDGGDEATAVSDDVKKKKEGGAKTNGSTAGAGAASGPTNGPSAATVPAAGALGGDTIAKAVATALIEKLKPLDKDKGIVPFLAAFPYAKKVSEIRAADEAKAVALAAQLAGGPPAAAEDPFA